MKKIKSELKMQNMFSYILICFAIILLIIIAMGGYLFHFLHGTIYSDFLSANEQHLSEIVNRHENDMQILNNIVVQVELSEDVTKFRLKSQPEKSVALKKQLKGYTTVSQFFDLILYHFHEDDYLYNWSSSIDINYFLESGCVLENESIDEFNTLIKDKNINLRILPEQNVSGGWIMSYFSNTKQTIMFRAIPPYLEDTLIFMIPSSYYDELLSSSADEKRKDFLFYDGNVIVGRGTSDMEHVGLEMLMKQKFINCNESSIVQQKITFLNEEYLFSVCKGQSGICYVSLQSMKVYYDKIFSEWWVVLALITACMMPACFIIFYISKGVLNKVKKLNLLLNEESYYDLSSIENGIQTLVMTYKESEKESLVFKKTRFIRNFVRGDFSDRQLAIIEAQQAELDIDHEKYVVILLRSRELNNENLVYTYMLEMINKEENVDGYGIHMINNNQNLFVLFGSSQEMIEKTLEKMLKIEKQFCQDYVIAISDYHNDFLKGPKAYLEADTAFDNYLLMDNSNIIRFSFVSQKDYVGLLPENYLQRLRYAIRNGDKIAVEVAVSDICSRIKRENVSLYAFRIFYNDIIQILLSELKNDKVRFDNFYNVFTLSQCLNIQDFQGLLCEICNAIIDSSTGKTVKNTGVVHQAIAYMQENFYDSNLTMNALADYLKISAVTLSVEFKNEMDIKPSDYLANLRLEKAKTLLRSTNMLVKDISQAVGYEDDRVFLRRFKKYTGMTPGEYRIGQ